MNIAYVTVRYGPAVVGGAEQACRQLAEHLAAAGVGVSVHTTCATDAVTWADVLAPGTTVEAGVTVHRHRSTAGRDRRFEQFSADVLADPPRQGADRQARWLDLQGPVCPAAVDSAAGSGADLVVATPYLYWPTVAASRAAPDRFVLHPAAHDEPPIRLPLYAGVFGVARGLAFYTDAERRLVERLWPALAATPQLVVGLGVDPWPGPVGEPPVDRPYVLCLGRVDAGKGTDVLARFFASYKRRRPGPLALVFSGPVVHPPDPHPDIVVTGPLDEPAKWSALSGATALVNPSANESFSIVLLEAWSVGTPALVNARCGATSEHVRRSQGGLAFAGYAEFEAALDALVDASPLRTAMAESGRAYVERLFAWPVVTERYVRWLASVATAPRPTTIGSP